MSGTQGPVGNHLVTGWILSCASSLMNLAWQAFDLTGETAKVSGRGFRKDIAWLLLVHC